MAEVVSLAAVREERTPYFQGTGYCTGCQTEWEAVAPVGTQELECPACHLPKGVWKHAFGPVAGDAVLRCDCGCEALFAYKRKGLFFVKCMGCGDDLTETFFDG